jgi:ElaB/YqjD/DUF883 family membrane-anchored ribosome-binding protein
MSPETNPYQETTTLADKTKEAVSAVVDKTMEAVSGVSDRIEEAVTTAAQRAAQTASSVGHRVEEVAYKTVDKVEAGGAYVRERGVTGIVEDLGNFVRRNPLPSLAIGFTIGFLISQVMTPRD